MTVNPASSQVRENFGGNYQLRPASWYEPSSEDELLTIMKSVKGRKIRVAGRLHSWSSVICGNDVLISLHRFNSIRLETEKAVPSVEIGAGVQIKAILATLSPLGWTLPSLGLISEQTIAGAISTATHGSGRSSLSHYVTAVRVAIYDRETGLPVIEEIHSGDALRAVRCSLGSMGVIVSVRMECRRTYRIQEHWSEYQELSDVLDSENRYPLQQFFLVPWKWTYLVQHRQESDAPRSFLAGIYRIYWFLLIDLGLHLLLLFAVRLVQSRRFVRLLFRRIIPPLVIRNWKVVDDASKMLIMEHELFRHIETEIFVRRSHVVECLRYVRHVLSVMGDRDSQISADLTSQLSGISKTSGRVEELKSLTGTYQHHYPICVRRVQADETLISMTADASGDWYAVSLISYAKRDDRAGFMVMARFLNETTCELFGTRPHWGKVNFLTADVIRVAWPEIGQFLTEANLRDPEHVFRNEVLKELT
ncbi:MAG: FAD-binding protein [Planctomyces sp.]|nr:FAD-binding protein [Planctomyces sp.]